MPKERRPTVERLRELFLARHWEWVAVDNPEGFESGTRSSAWQKRSEALDLLVRAQRLKDARQKAPKKKSV